MIFLFHSRFESVTSSRRTPNNLITFRPHFAMDPEPHIEDDSDPEDDPGKLLNLWLGELDNLKKVWISFLIFLAWRVFRCESEVNSFITVSGNWILLPIRLRKKFEWKKLELIKGAWSGLIRFYNIHVHIFVDSKNYASHRNNFKMFKILEQWLKLL